MKNRHRIPLGRQAFSLIEVVIALSVVSFGLVTTMGLLPVGLGAQRQAANRARGMQALSEISNALQGVYTGSNGLMFPQPLQNLAPGKSGETSFYILANGLISESENGSVRARGFVKQYPATGNGVMPVYVSVAWPATASRLAGGWDNAQGSVESFTFVGTP